MLFQTMIVALAPALGESRVLKGVSRHRPQGVLDEIICAAISKTKLRTGTSGRHRLMTFQLHQLSWWKNRTPFSWQGYLIGETEIIITGIRALNVYQRR